MSLVDHLLDTRTPLELAKLAVNEAKDNARLRDELHVAQVELFWMKSAERNLIDQAAGICDGLAKLYNEPELAWDSGYTMAATRAADEIRQLKEKS